MKKPIILDGRSEPLSVAVLAAIKVGDSYDKAYRRGLIDREGLDQRLQTAKENIAVALGISSGENVIFTSSGVEAVNMGIKGLAWSVESDRNEIVVVEGDPEGFHEASVWCERFGFKQVVLSITSDGLLDPEQIEKLITTGTAIVAISSVTPEILVPRDLHILGEHVHSVGAKLLIALDLELPCQLPHQAFHHADILTLDGEAIGGPAGTGLLILNSRPEYPKSPIRLAPLISGGATQNGLRAGRFPLGSAMGLATALEESINLSTGEFIRLPVPATLVADAVKISLESATEVAGTENCFTALRDAALEAIADHIPGAMIPWVADPLPCGITFLVPDVEGEAVVMLCEQEDLFISTGSACSRTTGKPSAVLTAIGFTPEEASGAIHLNFRKSHSVDDIRKGVEAIGRAVDRLRRMR